ncbi:Hpt domain-containing protein [Roseovarius rhodophyticola]|uniref:Hpt domain-containing protein n=1 Tax=Roseovarius rhodophyticola TaxID=3080827 RepID=A0ABZ2TMU6_9RHOB|nr:Hpt domain-containing protein [Roseovarius sp. W115]MDV2930080.1 Hpt domain-containing protein [Roseovarius sp. W115]
MIDWTRVARLREEIGADDFSEVIEVFLEEVEGEIAPLRQPCEPSQLEAVLHFLKGSALNLGFETFAELCADGESKAAEGHVAEIDLHAILKSYSNSKVLFLDALEHRF